MEAVRCYVITRDEAVGRDGLESKADKAAEGDVMALNVVVVLE